MDKVKITSLKCGNYPEISLIFIKGLSFCKLSMLNLHVFDDI